MNHSQLFNDVIYDPDQLYSQILARCQAIQKTIAYCNKHIKKASEGHLLACANGNSFKYYHVVQNSAEYISKRNPNVIQSLAQKEYCRKILKTAMDEYEALQQCLNRLGDIDSNYLKTTHLKMHPGKQQYINPFIQDDESYAKRWLSENYIPNPMRPEDKIFQTLNNELVRSKSEVILANTFLHSEIPYKYECPLVIGGKTLYPDFTLLNPVTHRIFYWEHFGMFDDPDYYNKAVEKINFYETHDIHIGTDLIITFETSKVPLNQQYVESVLHEHFK